MPDEVSIIFLTLTIWSAPWTHTHSGADMETRMNIFDTNLNIVGK